MDHTLLIYTEQGTTEPSESIEEELVLPHMRVRFQDETLSEVRLRVRSRKKIFQYIFMMCISFSWVVVTLGGRGGLPHGHSASAN